MKLDKNTKLADLMYGHGDKFICRLAGRFEPEKYPNAPVIQIDRMKCGCWIVGDGNNRIGLILRVKPEATIADVPKDLIVTSKFGEWDHEMMEWWNPCPKSFREVMIKQPKNPPAPKNAIHGMIERDADGKFFACTHGAKNGGTQVVTGRTASEAKRLLGKKLETALKREKVFLVLKPMSPLEDHRCIR
jgi:hypothetical protein